MNRFVCLLAAWSVFPVGGAPAATVLFCPFDSLKGWSIRAVGATSAAIVDESNERHSVEVTSRRGTIFLSRQLPLEAVQNARLSVNCLVKTDTVVVGPQLSSTAKLHLAVETPTGIRQYHAQFSGTADWYREGFAADVPADAKRVLLNLGLEACAGRVWFGRLVVENDRRGVYQLDLTPAANASHERLGVAAFPKGTLQWHDVPFRIIDADRHEGGDCFRLKGVGHEDWPESTASPIAVGTKATAIYILHGALEGRETAETPCAIWTARFAGGDDYGLSVFEGRQIGAIGQGENLENWQVAWRQRDADGNWVSFGVTKWPIYSDTPLVSISCRAYGGAPPLVLAVTAVEEPPPPPSEAVEYDEMGEIPE